MYVVPSTTPKAARACALGIGSSVVQLSAAGLYTWTRLRFPLASLPPITYSFPPSTTNATFARGVGNGCLARHGCSDVPSLDGSYSSTAATYDEPLCPPTTYSFPSMTPAR